MSVQDLITGEAKRQGIDPSLALAVAWRESRYDQSARGSSGEIGVFQLMPGTAAELGVDPSDLAQNIAGGIRYLKQQLARFGSPALALQAYNAGPGAVSSGRVPAQSIRYAADVLARAGSSAAPLAAGFTLPDFPALDFGSALQLEPLTIAAVAIGAVAILLLLRR
jgi:soluble lytic murein transglycosylase-like protein